MATRTTFTSSTAGPVTGDGYMDDVAGHIGRLYDAAAFPLTSVAGGANAVTASLDPLLSAALVTGMKFTITWALANTGGVTLALNGGSAVAVLDADGGAMTTGQLRAGSRSLLEFVGSAFRVISGAGSTGGGGGGPIYQRITVSGTWTKPSGYPDDHMVLIEAWGAGGGGHNAGLLRGGGGGGAYVLRWMRYINVPSSVTVTIGAGGAVSAAGGNTSFGALVTAFGGGGGSASAGGGGGGSQAAGTTPAAALGGGNGSNTDGVSGTPAFWTTGGGGGGLGAAGNGGGSHYGGGGGGGGAGSAGGTSLFGGNGGAPSTAGSAPAGGGGINAAGARGEVRVWL